MVVLTDGRNEDPHGISLDQLLGRLHSLSDRRRPVPVIGIGIGPDIDVNELNAITGATGGRTFAAPDPAHIGDAFYGSLAALAGS